MKKAVITGGSWRGAGDDVAELADLHAGGVDDFHAVELGEREGSGDLVHEGVPILSLR